MRRYAVNYFTINNKYDGYEVSCGKADGTGELEDLLQSVINNQKRKDIAEIVEVVALDD